MKSLPHFQARVMPVIVLTDRRQAMPLAEALWAGGIDVMEITLRHPAGISCIEEIATRMPQMKVGAGTVVQAEDLARVKDAGAQFALSPGGRIDITERAIDIGLPYIPGVMTPTEAMIQQSMGIQTMKLFPASQAGGVGMLKALAGPLPDLRFCPTGGVQIGNLMEFLALPNVPFVGGTWICPPKLIEEMQWAEIATIARQTTALIESSSPAQ